MTPSIANRPRQGDMTSEEQEQAETLKRDVVEPYLKQYFPFVDFEHPQVSVPQRARSRPRHSVVTDRPEKKLAVFRFTYASPPDSSLKRVVYIEATEEGDIVHVAASK